MMTTEKAIQLLHRLQDEQFDGEYGDECREALEMAVRALSGDGDLISRQQAIDALENAKQKDLFDRYERQNIGIDWAINALKALPSAQPEPCEDAVSRHRLLSDLKKLIVAWEKYPVMAEQIKGVEAAIGYVELIPSAQPQRKKGRWIYGNDFHWYTASCNKCGYTRKTDIKATRWNEWKFCPSCGVKMEGEDGHR